MNVETDDPDRSSLISQISSTIAAEYASEKIQREITMLSNTNQSSRTKTEAEESLEKRFHTKVAEYIHQRSEKNPRTTNNVLLS